MPPTTSPVDRVSAAVLSGVGVDAGSGGLTLHALVERFLDLPIALQILLLVLALPGGAFLITALGIALRSASTRRRRPR